jgi:hypothetical protein
MDVKAINAAIIAGSFSIADLDSISDAVKYARARAASKLKYTLSVGQEVTVNHSKVQGQIGKVVNIKLKKADVNFGGTMYTVPLTMCCVV